MPGVTVRDIDPHEFVAAYAKYLKRSGRVTLPKNSDAIKTGGAALYLSVVQPLLVVLHELRLFVFGL
jgi:hypothetical protein